MILLSLGNKPSSKKAIPVAFVNSLDPSISLLFILMKIDACPSVAFAIPGFGNVIPQRKQSHIEKDKPKVIVLKIWALPKGLVKKISKSITPN